MRIFLEDFYAGTDEEKQKIKQAMEKPEQQQGEVSKAMQDYVNSKKAVTLEERIKQAAAMPGISGAMADYLKNKKQ